MTVAMEAKKGVGAPKELFTGMIPLNYIEVAENFRRDFDEKKIKDLAENVGKFGVLQPILVRPGKSKSHFWLIAGERRHRASKMAKLDSIPARVLDVDETTAAEIQVLENLHREDLNPIEEAKGLATLLDSGNYEVEDLASRIDKSKDYVYRSIRLLDLCKEAQDAIAQGKMRATSGLQLLRVTPDLQKALTKDVVGGKIQTLNCLRDTIEENSGRDLNDSTFPKDKDFGGGPACTTCPRNSGNQGMLFDGAKKGTCTDGKCYDKKMAAFIDGMATTRAQSLGVKSLGLAKRDYGEGLEGVKGAVVLPGKVDKKLIEANKERFAVAGVAPRWQGQKAEAVLVCLDPSILPREMRGGGSAQMAAANKRQREKQKKEKVIEAEMFRKIVPALTGRSAGDMLKVVVGALDRSYAPRAVWDAMGIPKKGQSSVDPKEYAGLHPDCMIRLAFMLAAGDLRGTFGEGWNPRYKQVGIDLPQIRTAAEAVITKAIAEDKKAKAKKK